MLALFACIYVPDLPLQAVLGAAPHLRHEAVVVLNAKPPLYTVAAANQKAREKGIQAGMTRLQAEACPGVEIQWRSPAEELATHQALLECAQKFSPRIEATAIDTLVIDIAGLGHLLGSPPQIAEHLAQAAKSLGLEVNVAVARNPEAARLAARGNTGITVIPAGEESRYLSSLPLHVLELSAEMAQTFEHWGIRSSGELALLPEVELTERLGQAGVRLQTLARGAGSRPIIPVEELPAFREVRELDYALETLEPLSFILSAMLSELCQRLEQHALAAGEIWLRLDLDSRAVSVYELTYKLSVPVRNSKTLLKLLQLNLEASPPEAAVVKVTLVLEPAKPRNTQHGLFLTSGPEPQKLELALTRIINLLGGDRAGSAQLLDSHCPDSFRVVRFQAPAFAEKSSRKYNAHTQTGSQQAAMRRFRPSRRARVWLRDGYPISLSFSGMHGKIISASGPWRTTGDWWRDSRWERDEWDVAANLIAKANDGQDQQPASEVALYRISYDLFTSRWLVEGTYD